MNSKITVNKTSCIVCERCVRICPSGIFRLASSGQEIELQHLPDCINCGHCVGVCPTDSVRHPVFPGEKVHPVHAGQLPAPGQLTLLLKSRRSNRAFRPDPVPDELLTQILEAAHRAPTASNLQQVSFTLVTDPAMLARISDLTMSTFISLKNKLSNPLIKPFIKCFAPEIYNMLPRFRRLEHEHEKGNDPILRKAKALILIHTPEKNRFGNQDANLAYQNGSLMAESLGVSQFYTGFLCTAILRDRKKQIPRLLGIEESVHAGMALGMPEFRFLNYIDKKEIRLRRI